MIFKWKISLGKILYYEQIESDAKSYILGNSQSEARLLDRKIMNCCSALDNTVLFGIVSKEWYGSVNYLEPCIMAEQFLYQWISRMQVMFLFSSVCFIVFIWIDCFSNPLFTLRFTMSCLNFLFSIEWLSVLKRFVSTDSFAGEK